MERALCFSQPLAPPLSLFPPLCQLLCVYFCPYLGFLSFLLFFLDINIYPLPSFVPTIVRFFFFLIFCYIFLLDTIIIFPALFVPSIVCFSFCQDFLFSKYVFFYLCEYKFFFFVKVFLLFKYIYSTIQLKV